MNKDGRYKCRGALTRKGRSPLGVDPFRTLSAFNDKAGF
jgi:hypothetical protein